MVAEHLAQRGMQQVGRGVVAPDRLAALAVDGGQRVLARRRSSPLDAGPVRDQPGSGETVSRTSALPVSVTIVPVSPTWPPPSA